jgi:hypothetical protein
MPATSEQLETQIAELEALRRELLFVPTSGQVGNTHVNLAGKMADIDRELERLRLQLSGLKNGGRLLPTRRGC